MEELLQIYERMSNFNFLNGLILRDQHFDSKFTCYRGMFRSQNDIAFTNNLRTISTFQIMDKLLESDHCPIVISCNISISSPLSLINKCTEGIFNYDYYDIKIEVRIIARLL